MTHPGPARDVDIHGFLDGLSFKPANTEAKQLAHEAARQLVALLGAHLYDLLPPGREKSLVFTMLEDVLMRANRALALGGGPKDGVTVEALDLLLSELQAAAVQLGALLPQDPCIEQYKTDQRGELATDKPEKPFTRTRYTQGEEPEPVREFTLAFQEHWAAPAVSLGLTEHKEGENIRNAVGMDVDDPDVLEEFAASFLSAANRLRAAQALDAAARRA